MEQPPIHSKNSSFKKLLFKKLFTQKTLHSKNSSFKKLFNSKTLSLKTKKGGSLFSEKVKKKNGKLFHFLFVAKANLSQVAFFFFSSLHPKYWFYWEKEKKRKRQKEKKKDKKEKLFSKKTKKKKKKKENQKIRNGFSNRMVGFRFIPRNRKRREKGVELESCLEPNCSYYLFSLSISNFCCLLLYCFFDCSFDGSSFSC